MDFIENRQFYLYFSGSSIIAGAFFVPFELSIFLLGGYILPTDSGFIWRVTCGQQMGASVKIIEYF